jgi:hypothetical protein
MQLTERLPRQPAWLLVSRILREQAQGMLAKLAQRLRLRDRARLAVEDFEVPDSAWARDSVELVAKVSPAFLLNHGVRSYAFGAALAGSISSASIRRCCSSQPSCTTSG